MSSEESLPRMQRDVRRLQEDVSKLHAQMQRLRRRTDQLSALREAEPEAARRLARLESVLDFSAACAHVQDAVARASMTLDPVAHLAVEDLFPPAMAPALADAIPPAAFFEGGDDQRQELRVPQQAGLLPAIVTWSFVTELILHALGPALLDRFNQPLADFVRATYPAFPPFQEWSAGMALTQGRIVRQRSGPASVEAAERPWDFLTGMVPLGRPHECAIVYLGRRDALSGLLRAPVASPENERYTYEFGFGPTRDSRRMLIARLDQREAAIWSRA